MSYQIKIEKFEGPLDLLLFLIKENEIDIYDIPIALITKQYLEYIELMQTLDLEMAGEFILMAAILIQIKVQTLLPSPSVAEEEIEDPRTELVKRLVEYQKFKEASSALSSFEEEQRKIFSRAFFDAADRDSEGDLEREFTLFDLITIFHEALKNVNPPLSPHSVKKVDVTVDQRMGYIISFIKDRDRCAFSELIAGEARKLVLIVTFLAILELMKRGQIVVRQRKLYSDFWIQRR